MITVRHEQLTREPFIFALKNPDFPSENAKTETIYSGFFIPIFSRIGLDCFGDMREYIQEYSRYKFLFYVWSTSKYNPFSVSFYRKLRTEFNLRILRYTALIYEYI